ncbi:alpha/beta fold hydrolase [Allosaccharopolyspora coralli]|uniref:alpha/beta fold hydrolase n=1 Tax=Allosaccharopolyspora coralli TaxID=2665642 RepID=UPI0016526E5D|nr:alpha/beta hydrolase [Allosaccharopolyspora coralli]
MVPRRLPVPAAILVILLAVAACAAPPAEEEPGCGVAPDGFEHAHAQVGEDRLHYVVGGEGPPVVLLHGFPETWQAWRGVMAALRAEHRVLAVDLPAMGCSSSTAGTGQRGMDKTSLARTVHGLVRQLNLGPVAMTGHDMGGMVAYAYARTFPQETSHLAVAGALLPGYGLQTLIDPPPGQNGLPHLRWFMTRPEQAQRAITSDPRGFLTRFIATPEVLSSPAFEDYVRVYSQPERTAAALRLYRTLPADAAANRRAARVPMPGLAVDGASGMPESVATSLQRAGTSVRAEAIPDAGHYAPEQNPDAFAEVLRRFLG